jgi:hypothetical protein
VALLELQCLQDRLVVLVLVLEHHVVDVTVTQQRIHVLEVHRGETREHAAADLVHDAATLAQPGKRQRAALAARVLERVVHAGHFHEFDRAVEVSGEPELLEMGDMAQIPQDRAHQRIMLQPELLVGERRHNQQRPGAGLEQPLGDGLGIHTAGQGDSRHRLNPRVLNRLLNDSACVGCAKMASVRSLYRGFPMIAR